MVEQAKWVTLKFDFNIPVGKYPTLLERLFGTAARIEELIKGLSEDVLENKMGGVWSIKEHIGHLTDLEVLFTNRLDDFDANVEVLSAADMSNQKTNEANHNSKTIEALLQEFRNARLNTCNRIKDYNEEKVLQTALHPRLKVPMRVIDLAYFFAEHDDHHMAIIRRLKNS